MNAVDVNEQIKNKYQMHGKWKWRIQYNTIQYSNSPAHAIALLQIMFLMLKYCCYPLMSISFPKKQEK